jgi:hypothetical protein
MSRLAKLENRVKELCTLALQAEEPELDSILCELRHALHEHTEALTKLAARLFPVGGREDHA